MKYVVDTSIINKLVDGKIDPSKLPTDGEFIASHIQIGEINNTKDPVRRAQLFLRVTKVAPELVPTESFALNTTWLDHVKLSDGTTYQEVRDALDKLNGSKPNNINDALIAETAINNGFILLTADDHLREVVLPHGGQVRYWKV
jgi:predicted nucleic acid-binding protein